MRYLTTKQILKVVNGKLISGSTQTRANGINTDSRKLRPLDLFVALEGPNFDGHNFVPDVLERGAAGAVVNKSYEGHLHDPLRHRKGSIIAVDDTLAALGDIARYYRSTVSASIVAVTGSNGKTTTKAMVHHILKAEQDCVASPASYNNAVGVPSTLFMIDPHHSSAVVEMGTNHPGEIKYLTEIARPDVAVITNISATHTEGLSSPKGVAAEKETILDGLKKDGIAVFNRDDFWSREIEKHWSGTSLCFGIETDAEVKAGEVSSNEDGIGFTCAGLRFSVPVLGEHNVYNALAAAAAARALGINWHVIRDRLATFHLPRMRMQVERTGDVVLINDAYNANPASMLAAVKTLRAMPDAQRKILVMGDMKELGGQSAECHRDIGRKIAASGIDLLWATGSEAARAADAALHNNDNGRNNHRMQPEQVYFSPDTADAAAKLPGFVQPGDVVMVKGSRALRMERIIKAIRERLPRKRELPKRDFSADVNPMPAALHAAAARRARHRT